MQARKLELHIRDQSNIHDNFWAGIDAIQYCNVWSTVVLKSHIESRVGIAGHIFQ
jgi:hypothetical protein